MKNRFWSFVIIFVIYAAAVAAGAAVLMSLPGPEHMHPFFTMFLADVAATAVVFIFSLLFKNASVYDPYWSVIPVFLIIGMYWYYEAAVAVSHLLVLLPLLFWAVRLTYNWARGFENLEWEDWRYRKFRAEHPKLFPFISFTGIMLMPTVLVYLGTLPIWFMLASDSFSVWYIIGGAIILFAAVYQTIADEQMRKFRSKNKGKGLCIHNGLWKYSRHPNYLGEILIWWGLAVAGLGTLYEIMPPKGFVANPDTTNAMFILSFFGTVLITCLFKFISIPLMEKHILENKPAYAEYKKAVRTALVPWKRQNAISEIHNVEYEGETKNV